MKGIALLLSKKAGKPPMGGMPDAAEPDQDDSYDEDLKGIAQDLIDAIGKKDVDAVAEALRAAHGACSESDSKEPQEE